MKPFMEYLVKDNQVFQFRSRFLNIIFLLSLLSGLWGYWHCGHCWPILQASGDSEDDCGEADEM
jgi:hypothetical protein